MQPQYTPSDIKRFWSYVEKSDDPSECWFWKGTQSSDKMNYGRFWHAGRLEEAHRAAYVIANGPIGEGLHCLHRCDHPLCVRPDHLFLGTNDDNIRDKIQKGRTVKGRSYKEAALSPGQKGERHWKSRLTAEQVQSIHERRARGERLRSLASEFGLSETHVSEIARGRTWEKVDRPDIESVQRWATAQGERLPQSKLTESQVREIRDRAANGESQARIARDYGVNQQAVFKIVHRQNWKHVV
ncbi:MAG: HNH endonuclease [Patescibacteria group bacterium]|nr:HNH endonuclease [Patescibacteria group bacterium]